MAESFPPEPLLARSRVYCKLLSSMKGPVPPERLLELYEKYGRSFGLASGAAGWLPKPSGAKFSSEDGRRLELCSRYGCALARTRLLVPCEVMIDGKPNASEERVRFHLLRAGYPRYVDHPVEWMAEHCDDPMLTMDMVDAIIGFHLEPGPAEPVTRESRIAKYGEA